MEGGPAQEESIKSLVSQLVDDGKQFAQAEVKLQLARWTPRIGHARNAAILAVVALGLGQAVLVAALVGLLLILQRPLGPAGATAVVVVAGLVMIALLGWAAMAQVRRVTADRDDR